MTRFAFLSVLAFAVESTSDVLRMNVVVVALAREVASRMAIEAARMFEDGNDGNKQLARASIVVLYD
jgi:hypothetical protein